MAPARDGYRSSVTFGDTWVEGEGKSDWLGMFLPGRFTNPVLLLGTENRGNKREALTYLAYLRHQRDWMLSIEQARRPPADAPEGRGCGCRQVCVTAEIDRVVAAIEGALGVTQGKSDRRFSQKG